MAAADVLSALLQATLASSAAVALVLMLRRSLRGAFGADVGYAAWLLVPAVLVVLALPGPRLAPSLTMSLPTVVALQPAMVAPQPALPLSAFALATWIAGAVGMLSWMAWRQSRFQHAMGRLQRRADGTWQAEASTGLPAVVGMLPSRIVLPRDFEQRYDAGQRALMLAHERVHLSRGDVRWNALAMLLRSLFWFNPLLHVAHARFRQDQELACDQRVVARHPNARHAYGEAMLKTQLATQSLPLGCHWGHGHPLKERLEMLKQPVPTSKRLRVGSAVVALLVSGGACVAWASQAPKPVAPPVTVAAPSAADIAHQRVAKQPATTTASAHPQVQPAKQAIASRANQWSSYEQLVGSLSASWEPPKPAEDGC